MFPHLPFLAFGPLDLWYRVLNHPKATIPLRYYPRFLFGLAVSFVITVLTLPERLLVGGWLRLRNKKFPGPVIILGYYRSGTTHLQFLLSRDPNLYSPRWTQCLSPQWFAVSWSLMNWFLLPLFPDKRPQDNAAFGTDIPAEDDFALSNGAAVSSLIGRHVLPEKRDYYDRYHDLRGLTAEELTRYRDCQLGFVRKISLLAGVRRILLKTPSHTARVGELMSLLAGTDGVRYIHISRKPDATYRSNVGLHKVLNERYHLQEPLSEEEICRRIITEYLATEDLFLTDKAIIPAGRLAELRMEDLMADPVGQIKRLYGELNLPFTDEFEQRLLEYLDATRSFEPNKHKDKSEEETKRVTESLDRLRTTFGHDRPAVAKQEPPQPRCLLPEERRKRLAHSRWASALVAGFGLVIWLSLTWLIGIRLDLLAWLIGISVGSVAIHKARRGSVGLGLWCAGFALVVAVTGSVVTTRLIPDYMLAEMVFVVFWGLLGTLGAYRLGSRRWI